MSERPAASDVTAVVLAGGTSSRFGSDKAAFPLAGRPLVRWVIDGVRTLCGDVVVVRAPGSRPWPFPLPDSVRLVTDPVPHLGPLAGLARGLEVTQTPWALAVACDAPTLQPAVVARLLALRTEGDAVLGELDGRAQPFPGVYRTDVARAAFVRALASGERGVRAALASLRVVIVPEEELRRLDPELLTYRNANTPAEAEALVPFLAPGRRLAKRRC